MNPDGHRAQSRSLTSREQGAAQRSQFSNAIPAKNATVRQRPVV
ncbi:hypothetical protein AB395_00005145 (plasmid) [Sinorhizobium fredii CCBAU 45436]|nr:hypothetical protein AB395_00005145 [Sinorhizobium fredii CCBAU 45436]